MKRHLLISEFMATPWALMPERLNATSAMLQRWAAGQATSPEITAAIANDKAARAEKSTSNARAGGGSIAVLPFYGVVTQRPVADVCGPGAIGIMGFTQLLREAIADDSIGAILIDIDSPGGSVYGTGELAEEILANRSKKPIIGLANSLAASAAYWVGAACAELYVTPSGEVGSIGVWQAHFDYSKAMAEEGVTPTLISAGKFKVEGNPYQPLDEEAHAYMQSRVDDYYTAFTKGVSKSRSVPVSQVRDGMGQGRCLGADAALAQNMVDGIMTFDQVIKKMQKNLRDNSSTSTSRRAAAERDLQILG